MKNIVEIDGKQYINANVVMLSTLSEDRVKSHIYKFIGTPISCFDKRKTGELTFTASPDKIVYEAQHLYVTSDEEIKEGDLVYNSISNGLEKWSYKGWIEEPDFKYLGYKKVIATTDTSLKTTISPYLFPRGGACKGKDFYLHKIPQQFIEKWIEEYNKGKVITKVLVEVEEYEFKQTEWFQEAPYIHTYREYRLKLNQNEITIKSKKDSWSREEHSKSIADFSKDLSLSFNLPFKESLDFTIKWIEENL